MEPKWKSFTLLLVGFALLLNPWLPGVHLGSGAVYRYEAATVDYTAGEGFELRNAETGRRLERLPVDDQILCEDDWDWWFCRVGLFVLHNGSVPGYAGAGLRFDSQYEFVVLDDRLYRPVTVARGDEAHLALEPVNDSDPLREVAATDLIPLEQNVVESGRVVTYQNLSRRHQLLRVDGEYYFVYQTAHKDYNPGHDFCVSTGHGFCENADWKRRTDTALTLGSWLVGVTLVFQEWDRIRR